MKTYEGRRNEHYELIVTVEGKHINPWIDVFAWSPKGFECGYGGVGATQLALAILMDHLNDKIQAFALSERFKWEVIVKLPRDGWRLTANEIQHFVRNNASRPSPVITNGHLFI